MFVKKYTKECSTTLFSIKCFFDKNVERFICFCRQQDSSCLATVLFWSHEKVFQREAKFFKARQTILGEIESAENSAVALNYMNNKLKILSWNLLMQKHDTQNWIDSKKIHIFVRVRQRCSCFTTTFLKVIQLLILPVQADAYKHHLCRLHF